MQDDQQPIARPRRALGADPAPQPPRRRRHVWRIIGIVLLVLALVAATTGYFLHRHLNQNLSSTSVDLPSDVQGSQPGLTGLPAGVAQNILVIGTDARKSAEDCKLGGACGKAKIDGETNADVEMVVHIAADHKSMGIVSIPRDTVVDLPACNGNGKSQPAHRDRVNSSLNYGIDCTVRTIHQLTGLPITHFAMVDFSGVVTMSDAVGGVDVCVDNNVYDTYSHLKLTKGDHTLKGVSALQFLRTRHGFGDGSDLGRTVAQHLFLSSMQRKLESAGTLLNPVRVYNLADAATQALTVDRGLASVDTLAQVATTAGRIPTSTTAFVTMPTVPNPENQNTVVPAESAKALFAKLAADQPLATAKPSQPAKPSASAGSPTTTASSTPSGTPSSSASASPSGDPATNGVAQVSSQATGCAHVSTQKTVMINGVPMTPSEAFDKAPRIPLSAP